MSHVVSLNSATSLAALVVQASEMSDRLPCTEDSWLWFSEVPAELELAKAGCERCPLRLPCLSGAISRAETCGVWGGEIFVKGRIVAYKRPRGRTARQAA